MTQKIFQALGFLLFSMAGLTACAPQAIVEPIVPAPTLALNIEPTSKPIETIALPTAVAQLVSTQAPPATPTPIPVPTKTSLPTATAVPAEPTVTAAPDLAEDQDQQPSIYAVVGVESDDTLNVRDGAGVDYDVVGELPYNATGVELVGEGVQVGGSIWSEISFEQTNGWVNLSFLAAQFGQSNTSAESASAILLALKVKDFETLASYAHPTKGVRFSPNTYVRDEDVVLSAADIAELENNSAEYIWGSFDGEGGPIEMTFADYYDRFVYNADYFRPHSIGFDTPIGYGNVINNIPEYYPDAVMTEYHFPGFDPDFGGLDWTSLRLIMEEVDGEWRLVGVVHSEWTV